MHVYKPAYMIHVYPGTLLVSHAEALQPERPDTSPLGLAS